MTVATYIGFLRAVNVGQRWVKMERLRAHLSDNGFDDVVTHIQSGNVRVTTSMRSVAKVESALRGLISDEFGFDVPVIVRTPAALRQTAADADARSPRSALTPGATSRSRRAGSARTGVGRSRPGTSRGSASSCSGPTCCSSSPSPPTRRS